MRMNLHAGENGVYLFSVTTMLRYDTIIRI